MLDKDYLHSSKKCKLGEWPPNQSLLTQLAVKKG